MTRGAMARRSRAALRHDQAWPANLWRDEEVAANVADDALLQEHVGAWSASGVVGQHGKEDLPNTHRHRAQESLVVGATVNGLVECVHVGGHKGWLQEEHFVEQTPQ